MNKAIIAKNLLEDKICSNCLHVGHSDITSIVCMLGKKSVTTPKEFTCVKWTVINPPYSMSFSVKIKKNKVVIGGQTWRVKWDDKGSNSKKSS